MKLEFSLFPLIVHLFLTDWTYSLKFEHISDCYAYDLSIILGIDEVTFICGATNNESSIFRDSKYLKCSNEHMHYQYPGKIDFQNCRIPTISRNFFEMFTSLNQFIISNVELETLQLNIFREAKNLENLDISQNKLIEVPSLIFVNAVKLERVDFSNNTIKRVDEMAFKGAINLQRLNLSYNAIDHLDSHTLATPNLLTLDLSNNNLTELTEHIFDELAKLEHLDLSFNAISNLDIKTFYNLINLEELNLRRTNLSNIQLGTFSHQHKLISLDLSENSLQKLDFKLFFPILHDLRLLRLGRNQLKDLNGFRNSLFPKLGSLNIQGNEFTCSYLVHFMDSINWETIRLDLDVNSIDLQKSNIRGVNCNDITDDESTYVEPIEERLTQDSTLPNHSDDLINDVSLIFLCVVFTIFLILFTIANLNRIYSQFAEPRIFYKRESLSKENAVHFSNEGILMT